MMLRLDDLDYLFAFLKKLRYDIPIASFRDKLCNKLFFFTPLVSLVCCYQNCAVFDDAHKALFNFTHLLLIDLRLVCIQRLTLYYFVLRDTR